MQMHFTSGFAAAREAHSLAYKALDDVPEDQEFVDGKWAAECDAEGEAMVAYLSHPAHTPAEISDKLRFMRERDINSGWSDHAAIMAQIERDLIELHRPCVSPAMHIAFGEWRNAYLIYNNQWQDEFTQKHSAAFLTLMAVPCCTPGDFIVKVYANQLGEHGSTWFGNAHPDTTPDSFPFELDDSALDEGKGSHDGAAEEAYARDIRECDLGRCLLMLGRVDFDAEAWLDAARRAHMTVHVVIQTEGTRVFCTGQPTGPSGERDGRRWNMCQALIAGGLGVLGQERRRAVMDMIERHHPQLVMDCRDMAGEAA